MEHHAGNSTMPSANFSNMECPPNASSYWLIQMRSLLGNQSENSTNDPSWEFAILCGDNVNGTHFYDPETPTSPQLPRVMNITADLDISYALPLYGYIMPFLLVITIVANTLIVLVLSKRHMRTPTNAVLMAMALSDMFTLLFPAPWLAYLYTFGNHDRPLRSVQACYAYHIMNEVVPALFHTASIWLTLALAVQRYIYVCHPALARTWCTMARVNKAIAWIYILALLHQTTRFFDQEYLLVEIPWNNGSIATCARENAPWVDELFSLNGYYNCYFWFRVMFVHLVPCISLVVLNVLLFGALRRAQRRRQELLQNSMNVKKPKSSECRNQRDSNCTTLMLIVVVTVFLAVEIPLAIVTILHIIHTSLSVDILNYDVANVLILFTNFFISLSYPINFAIYCGMSRQFRETFQDLFIRGANSSHNRRGVGGATTGGGPVTTTRGGHNNGSSRYTAVDNGLRTVTPSEIQQETGV